MDYLPLEIVDLIVSELENLDQFDDNWDWLYKEPVIQPSWQLVKLAPYSPTSRNFQHAVERKTFKSITVDSSELAHLDSLLVGSNHRCSCLRTLKIRVLLASKEHSAIETLEEWERNDKVFSEAVISIMSKINCWELSNLELQLSGDSLTSKSAGIRNYITILQPSLIPQSSSITSIVFYCGREIETSSMVSLANKCSNLKTFRSRYRDRDFWFPHIQKAHRHKVSKALDSLQLGRLESIDLSWPSIHHPHESVLLEDNVDHLSATLHKLSLAPNLRVLSISGCPISPSLFWGHDSNEPIWPKLECYEISSTLVTPEGNTFASSSTDSSDHSFKYVYESFVVPGLGRACDLDPKLDWKRVLSTWSNDEALLNKGIEFLSKDVELTPYIDRNLTLDGELFECYVTRMVKAKGNMPRIQLFKFEIDYGGPPFNVTYNKSGYTINNTMNDPWRPSTELMSLLRSDLQDHEEIHIIVCDSL